MKSGLVPRRRFLSGVATAGLTGLAGCLGTNSTNSSLRYRLSTVPVAESLSELTTGYIMSDPTDIDAQEAIDYSDAYKQSVLDTLFEEGTADAVQWQLAYDRSFGTTTRPAPRFLENKGMYYSVVETDRSEFTEDRWTFYLDLVDEEPDRSDTVVTEPPSSLSETDQLVVERALELVQGHGKVHDFDNLPVQGRGPNFHHEMDPEASELVPSAPFDYLKFGDQYPQYLVPRTERVPVDLTRYTFAIDEIASSRTELEQHVESTLVDATFDETDDQTVVDIVRAATDNIDGWLYTERGELSEGFAHVVDRLGMTPYIPEEVTDRIKFNGALFLFEGVWYNASFSIR